MTEKSISGNILSTKHAESVRAEFLQLYGEMGDLLSIKNFSPVLNVLSDEGVTLKTDSLVSTFRTLLTEELSTNFNTMWEMQEITQSMAILDTLKERYKDSGPQWRPYGKSASEQTLPLRVRVLRKKIAYFEKQMEFQKKQMEEQFMKVASMRRYISEITERRNQILQGIAEAREQFPQLKNTIRNLQIESVELRYP